MMLSALACVAPRLTPLRQSLKFLHLTQVNPAARKGTREKARKKKVKAEIKKVGFIPAHLRKKAMWVTWREIILLYSYWCTDFFFSSTTDKHIDDSWKQIPTDNVGHNHKLKLTSIILLHLFFNIHRYIPVDIIVGVSIRLPRQLRHIEKHIIRPSMIFPTHQSMYALKWIWKVKNRQNSCLAFRKWSWLIMHLTMGRSGKYWHWWKMR